MLNALHYVEPVAHKDQISKQAYDRGYQHGYNQHTITSVAHILKTAVPPYEDEELNRLWRGGLEKGLSNRQGDLVAARKAAWYQKNRAKIVKQQRLQRQQKRKAEARQAMKHFTKQSHE